MNKETQLLEKLKALGLIVSREIHAQVSLTSTEDLSRVARESEDDTIYEIDRGVENIVLDFFEKEIGPEISCVLVMEGLPNERPVFGGSGRIQDAEFTVIIDPIDGTRGLMYAKRSAWILSGIARGASENLRLNDIIAAVQTEIPSPKQYLADQLFAFSGGGASAVRCDARTGEKLTPFVPRPSGAKNLRYGFASFCRFFPAAKDVVTAIECELNKRLASEKEENFYFEDQYICNSGQMFELIAGHDRLICDLRAVISRSLVKAGERPLLCSHPYDVCGELIARECGVIVTDEKGEQLNAPLDTTTDVSWIGYANKHIKALVEPHLLDILKNVDSYVASSL